MTHYFQILYPGWFLSQHEWTVSDMFANLYTFNAAPDPNSAAQNAAIL